MHNLPLVTTVLVFSRCCRRGRREQSSWQVRANGCLRGLQELGWDDENAFMLIMGRGNVKDWGETRLFILVLQGSEPLIEED